MLSFTQKLQFPELIYCGRFSIPPNDPPGCASMGKTVPLFRLNWEQHDLDVVCRQKQGRVNLLPDHWVPWLDNCRFVLEATYQSEIHRHCRSALLDWQLDSPFDQRIGEMLQQPAVSHVETAFRLMKDCLWNASKAGWEKGIARNIFLSAALLRFWDGKIREVDCARLEEIRAKMAGHENPSEDEESERNWKWGRTGTEFTLGESFLRDVEPRLETQKRDLLTKVPGTIPTTPKTCVSTKEIHEFHESVLKYFQPDLSREPKTMTKPPKLRKRV